jgi:hypothetical protein
LGCEDVLDLGGTNAKSQSAKRAMSRGMAITTYDGGAGKREALLWTDDVDDALPLIA